MQATKIRLSHVLWQPHQISAATSQAFHEGCTDNPFPVVISLPWFAGQREFETATLPFLDELETWYEMGKQSLIHDNEKEDAAKFGYKGWW
jgi:hypothetical protein